MSTPGEIVRCDAFDLGMELDCPGIAAHCVRNEHCNATWAECAACFRYDHADKCCNCGRHIGSRKGEVQP